MESQQENLTEYELERLAKLFKLLLKINKRREESEKD
jgi:hypothetical protein